MTDILNLACGWIQGYPLDVYIANLTALYGPGVVLTLKISFIALCGIFAIYTLWIDTRADDVLEGMGVRT